MRDRIRNQKAVVLPSKKKGDQRWAKEIEQSEAKERLKEIPVSVINETHDIQHFCDYDK
jgi:hypothetical protein